MQFEFDEDLAALSGLAEKIFTDRAGVDRVREVGAGGGFDADLWRVLADAGLLGTSLTQDSGGDGMGMLGLAALLEQQGRRVAPVPLWAVLASAALPIAEFGSPEQVERWLPGLLDGSVLVTGAFDGPDGHTPAVQAVVSDDGWSLHGEVAAVPAGGLAAAVTVPVRMPVGGTEVLLVPADRPGFHAGDVAVTSNENHAHVRFDGVPVSGADTLAGRGTDVAAWVRRRARVALAALAAGVCGEALAMTAAYTSQRSQFGRPLSTNQGVALRAADVHIDIENIRLTAHKAAWLLDRGEEHEAEAASLVAKWWASRAGLRSVHATQHLHGGIGADIDYPIHRYFLWGRQIAFTLGSASAVAADLGDVLGSS